MLTQRRYILAGIMASFGLACLVLSCASPRHADRDTQPPRSRPTPPQADPVTEIRAVWVSNTHRLDWDRATRNLQVAGYNTMYVNLASGGAAFYPSRLVPVLPGMEDDPVADGVELAHQRGIQVHAKLIATFMFKTTPAFQDDLLAANRVMRGPQGRAVSQAGFYWLCPSHESNRRLLIDLTREMVARYPVDGFHLDYIRFCEQPSCFCGTCRRRFEQDTGLPVSAWPGNVASGPLVFRFKQWQQQLINGYVRDLTSAARQVRPGLTCSAAVFSDLERAKEEKAQDWQFWLAQKYVDYVCAMNYVTDRTVFENLLRRQQAWAGGSRRVIAGIGSWKFTDATALWDQIRTSRQLGMYGFSLFSYDDAEERRFLPDLSRSR